MSPSPPSCGEQETSSGEEGWGEEEAWGEEEGWRQRGLSERLEKGDWKELRKKQGEGGGVCVRSLTPERWRQIEL